MPAPTQTTKRDDDDKPPMKTGEKAYSGDTTRTVRMPAGTLHFHLVGVNLLQLPAPDRNFLFGLIDMLDSYERNRSQAAQADDAAG